MNHVALPSNLSEDYRGSVLTFVVPAPQGCNLRCPYCFIRQRREEATAANMRPDDYKTFITEILERDFVAAITVQGYEPLLPESFAYTKAILESGNEHRIPTSIVTNGTYLEEHVGDLVSLELHDLAVSLDASIADVHDRLRGKLGSFDKAVSGLKRAVQVLSSTTITVASVLVPKKLPYLKGMPTLLAQLGIRRWVVTPLHKVGKHTIGSPTGDYHEIIQNLVELRKESKKQGITFIVDDDLGVLSDAARDQQMSSIQTLTIRRLLKPSSVSRILPTGQCSIGTDIDKEMPAVSPRWIPTRVHAADFIDSLRH